MSGFSRTAGCRCAEERQEHDPEHVEGRQERHEHQHDKWPDKATGPHRAQDLFLRQKAAEQRNAGERERPDQEDDHRLRHAAAEAAHPRHVVAAHGVDDRTGAQEEERLEESVREQMEEARRREPGADGRHHVAELRHGGVGQHALDVVLHAGQHGGQQGRERADPRDDEQDVGCEGEQP